MSCRQELNICSGPGGSGRGGILATLSAEESGAITFQYTADSLAAPESPGTTDFLYSVPSPSPPTPSRRSCSLKVASAVDTGTPAAVTINKSALNARDSQNLKLPRKKSNLFHDRNPCEPTKQQQQQQIATTGKVSQWSSPTLEQHRLQPLGTIVPARPCHKPAAEVEQRVQTSGMISFAALLDNINLSQMMPSQGGCSTQEGGDECGGGDVNDDEAQGALRTFTSETATPPTPTTVVSPTKATKSHRKEQRSQGARATGSNRCSRPTMVTTLTSFSPLSEKGSGSSNVPAPTDYMVSTASLCVHGRENQEVAGVAAVSGDGGCGGGASNGEVAVSGNGMWSKSGVGLANSLAFNSNHRSAPGYLDRCDGEQDSAEANAKENGLVARGFHAHASQDAEAASDGKTYDVTENSVVSTAGEAASAVERDANSAGRALSCERRSTQVVGVAVALEGIEQEEVHDQTVASSVVRLAGERKSEANAISGEDGDHVEVNVAGGAVEPNGSVVMADGGVWEEDEGGSARSCVSSPSMHLSLLSLAYSPCPQVRRMEGIRYVDSPLSSRSTSNSYFSVVVAIP